MPSLPERTMRRLVANGRVARMATLSPGGAPHVVPVVYAIDGDELYTAVDAKPKSSTRLQRLENLRRDPRVTLLVDHYEDDWERLWWVRVRGRGRVLGEGEDRDRARALLVEKYPQYRDGPPRGPVIVVEIEDWRGWSSAPVE